MADAGQAPASVQSDRNRGPALMAIFWVQCTIALFFISLRCYARILIKKIGKDDWIMLATAVGAAQDFLCVARCN